MANACFANGSSCASLFFMRVGRDQDPTALKIDLAPDKPCAFAASKRYEQHEADEVAHWLVLDGGPNGPELTSEGTWARDLPGFGRWRRGNASQGLASIRPSSTIQPQNRDSAAVNVPNFRAAGIHGSNELSNQSDVDTVNGELAGLHQRDGFPCVVDRLPAGCFRWLATLQHVLVIGVEGRGEHHGLDGAQRRSPAPSHPSFRRAGRVLVRPRA